MTYDMPDTWGYRLCRKTFEGQTRVALHEVYFKDGRPSSWTKNPVRIQTWVERDEADDGGDEKTQLAWLKEKITQAFEKEIIDLDMLEGDEGDGQ